MAYNMNDETGQASFEEAIADCKNEVKSLICLSGGLDSAYALWKYAQHCTEPLIHVHWVNFNQDRSKAEEATIDRLCKYVTKKFNKSIWVIKSRLEADRHFEDHKFDDDLFVVAHLSKVYAQKTKCKYIIIGDGLVWAYDRQQPHTSIKERHKSRFTALKYLIGGDLGVEVVTFCDANNLSEMYNEMPEEYISMIFNCRRPIYKYTDENSSIFASRCNSCWSCHKSKCFGWADRIADSIPIDVLKQE
jgi:hypothetical protein